MFVEYRGFEFGLKELSIIVALVILLISYVKYKRK